MPERKTGSYLSYNGSGQKSGAYIFRPYNDTSSFVCESLHSSTLMHTDMVTEVEQRFGSNSFASQVIRLYRHSQHVEFEWTIGPLPRGREVVTRYHTDLVTQNRFTTDSNGRSLLERTRNFRPTWPLENNEPISSNFYPVNSKIWINDQVFNSTASFRESAAEPELVTAKPGAAMQRQLTVLTDRTQGGTSLHDGQIELMIHRNTIGDDQRGVGEPLNERGVNGKGLVVRGVHRVYFDTLQRSPELHRIGAMHMFHLPVTLFASKLHRTGAPKVHNIASGSALPENIHVVSFERFKEDRFLLRLEHFFAVDDDTILSQPANVDLDAFFGEAKINEISELSLGANQLKSDMKRLTWRVGSDYLLQDNDGMNPHRLVQSSAKAANVVRMNPMEIRTFSLKLVFQPRKRHHL